MRAKIRGTAERPRLTVFRSLKHVQAQVIDDDAGKTVVAASDREVRVAKERVHAATVAIALEVGKLVAKRAKASGISTVVFDRGGHAYHGQVKAVADGARSEGLTL